MTMPTRSPDGGADQVAAGLTALCAWAARVEIADIPQPILVRAATVLSDDISAIIAARDEPEIRELQRRMIARASSTESTIFNGAEGKADRFSAAVANGAAADWCELDEGYRRATCHAGLYTIPALIAEAEATGASTEETLRALVLGYEIVARFARAFPVKLPVLHPHASLAAIGAAAAVGALRRLDSKTLLAALSSASTMVAPGPYGHAVEGALVRNVWPAAGAWCGMQAVEWAECGIAGTPHSPYDVFVVAFRNELAAGQFTEGLGAEWALADGYHKIHACCQYSHSAVEGIVGLYETLGGRLATAERIVVETHPLGMTLDNRNPATTLAAKFSLPHIVASTCLNGHAGAAAFAAADLHSPALSRLRDRIELRPYEVDLPWPNDRPARVTVSFADGTSHVAECLSAMGGPDRPFDAKVIFNKLTEITQRPYPGSAKTFSRLMNMDPAVLAEPWRNTVASLIG